MQKPTLKNWGGFTQQKQKLYFNFLHEDFFILDEKYVAACVCFWCDLSFVTFNTTYPNNVTESIT